MQNPKNKSKPSEKGLSIANFMPNFERQCSFFSRTSDTCLNVLKKYHITYHRNFAKRFADTLQNVSSKSHTSFRGFIIILSTELLSPYPYIPMIGSFSDEEMP